MSPPALVLIIPGVALFFLIQMLVCQAYHFHVTVSKTKRYPSDPDSGEKSRKKKSQEKGNMKAEQDSPMPHESDYDIQTEASSGDVEDYPKREEQLKVRRKSVFAESYDPSKDEEDVKIVHPKSPEEKAWLIDNLVKVTLFQHLAKDQVVTVVDAMYKQPVTTGDCVMKQGDHGSTFFLIQKGVFEVYIRDGEGVEHLIHTYHNKGSFGELALLYNQPRAATILVRTDGVLWAVDGQTFRRIVHKITHQKRMMYESLINNVPMLKSLEPHERANLVDALVPVTYQHEQQIIKQGDEGDGMYFIISGGVRIVMHTSNNKEVLLKELSNSEYFGELALVTNKPRAASAYAVGPTHLAFLDREAFERLLGPCMDVIRRHIDDYNDQMSVILQELN